MYKTLDQELAKQDLWCANCGYRKCQPPSAIAINIYGLTLCGKACLRELEDKCAAATVEGALLDRAPFQTVTAFAPLTRNSRKFFAVDLAEVLAVLVPRGRVGHIHHIQNSHI